MDETGAHKTDIVSLPWSDLYPHFIQTGERDSTLPECVSYPAILPGLYLCHSPWAGWEFSNGCRLVLPFWIGAAGWARLSDSQGMGVNNQDDWPKPHDICDDLYQSGRNGFGENRDAQLHKVLNSWADRVEQGEWGIGRDGVLSGMEKFEEADTKAKWRKYWIPRVGDG